jgi:hypothetical protein
MAGAVVREHGTRSIGEILLPWVDSTLLPLIHKVGPAVLARG